jgi:hypothetical protein
MASGSSYLIYDRAQRQAGSWHFSSLRDIVTDYLQGEPRSRLWSARLSTGLFGLTSCESGNRGPKGSSEVILAVDGGGVRELVQLGFIPCPSCHPERFGEEDGYSFWPAVKDVASHLYKVETLEDFLDKKKVPFDAGRVRFETFLPTIGATPGRIYLPKESLDWDVQALVERFDLMRLPLPALGFYDHTSPSRFTEFPLSREYRGKA